MFFLMTVAVTSLAMVTQILEHGMRIQIKKKNTTFNYTEIKQRFLLILGEETNIDKS